MKFIYFYPFANVPNDGPNKKVLSQCIHLIKMGLEVNLLFAGTQKAGDLNLEFIKAKNIIELGPSTRSNILLQIRRQFELRKILINLIESRSASDIIYLRYPYPLFYMLWPFSRQEKKCKIVNEHNTIEHKE